MATKLFLPGVVFFLLVGCNRPKESQSEVPDGPTNVSVRVSDKGDVAFLSKTLFDAHDLFRVATYRDKVGLDELISSSRVVVVNNCTGILTDTSAYPYYRIRTTAGQEYWVRAEWVFKR